jgi:hypothetical protein
MPPGGKRPGAGAPIGNINALKSGAHSPRFRGLVDLLITVPEVRKVLIAAWDRQLQAQGLAATQRRAQRRLLAATLNERAKNNKRRLRAFLKSSHPPPNKGNTAP